MAPKSPGIAQYPIHVGNRVYVTRSWNDPARSYRQDVRAGTCTCKAGENGIACKHLENARFAELFRCVGLARKLSQQDLLQARTIHVQAGDQVVVDACDWTLDQRQRGRETAPAPESRGDQEATGQKAAPERRLHA